MQSLTMIFPPLTALASSALADSSPKSFFNCSYWFIVKVCSANSVSATSYPQRLNPPSVNFMIFPLWTSVTDDSLCVKAYSMAERTSRCVPSFETGFTPNEDVSGKRTFVTPISSRRKA